MLNFLHGQEGALNYSPNDFLRLMEAVEESGGSNLPDPCTATKYKLKVPAEGGDRRWKDFFTTGCGHETRFVVLYDPQEPIRMFDTSRLSEFDPDKAASKARAEEIRSLPETHSPVVDDADAQRQTDRGAGYGVVCAVDDDMGKWPRFQHLIKDD